MRRSYGRARFPAAPAHAPSSRVSSGAMASPPVDLAQHLDRLWVISDTHFGHVNIIQYTNRPFRADEQNAIMLERWRETGGPSDPVPHLRDVGLDHRAVPLGELGRLARRPRGLVPAHPD